MTFQQIKNAALSLPEDSRADLVSSLVESLGQASENREHDQIWAEEAVRRYRDLRQNPESGVPAEEAFRKLRAAVR